MIIWKVLPDKAIPKNRAAGGGLVGAIDLMETSAPKKAGGAGGGKAAASGSRYPSKQTKK